MILVTGAAGKTGRAVLRALRRRNVTARALVRRAEQAGIARDAGASEIARGDLRDPEAMALAAEGVDAIYHICPNVSPDELEIGRAVIAAARRVKTSRFVYHSVLHPQTEAMPHHWRKLRVEERLLESGLAFTILQPAAYMQNVLAHWRSVVDEGVYPVPYAASARIASVDLEDVAEVAARMLTEDAHIGATYELCGEEVSPGDVAAALGQALGRPVRAAVVPVDAWRARATGLDEDRRETLIAMFRYYDRHGLTGSSNVLRWLLGREPTTFRRFVERIVRQRAGGGE